MENYADSILTEKQIAALADMGYTASITHFYDAESPRERGCYDSTWVGTDVPTQTHIVDIGDCFDDYVRNYCRQVLGCTPNDIVWSTVYKFEHSGVAYSLNPFQCPFDSGIHGFIYRTKQEVRESFGVKRVSKKLEEKIKESFQGELDIYELWENSSVYSVAVMDEDDNYIGSIGSIGGVYIFDNDTSNVIDAIDDILYASNSQTLTEVLEKESTNVLLS